MISFQCHNCDTKLSADNSLYGSTVNCPACELLLRVPTYSNRNDETPTDHTDNLNQLIKKLRKDLAIKSAEVSDLKKQVIDIKEKEKIFQAMLEGQKQEQILKHETTSKNDQALIKELQSVIQNLNKKVEGFAKTRVAVGGISPNTADLEETFSNLDSGHGNYSNENLIPQIKEELEIPHKQSDGLTKYKEMTEPLGGSEKLQESNGPASTESGEKKRNIFSVMRDRKRKA